MNKKSWRIAKNQWDQVDDPFYAYKSLCDENLPDNAPLEARLELLGFITPSRLYEKDGTIIELFPNDQGDFPFPYFLILDVKGKKELIFISDPPSLLTILGNLSKGIRTSD
jgi:hypothetical protein